MNQFDIAKSMFAPKSADPNLKLPAPCELATPEKLLELMDSHYVANALSAIKMMMGKITPDSSDAERRKIKDEVNNLKKKLPVVVPLAHFTNGHRAVEEPCNYVMSPWSMIDIDNVDDPKSIWENVVKPRVKELRIVWCFMTPSTRGLKIMYLRPEGMDEARSQQWMAGKLGLKDYDTSCKNVARIHYLVSRAYCYYMDIDKMFKPDLTNEGYRVDGSPVANPIPQTEAVKPRNVNPSHSEKAEPVNAEKAASTKFPTEYLGIPYCEYEQSYWVVNNGGNRPCYGDRETMTFDIALSLRHIAAFNVELLNRIIPCYDGFSEEEKLKAITSAVNYRRGPMPKKMQDVISYIKHKHAHQPDIVQALDELGERDATFYYSSLEECFTSRGKKFPMGIRDSFDGITPPLRMPMLVGIVPMIGALATDVRLLVHNEPSGLNLCTYVVGGAASGKSKLDALYLTWMDRPIKSDDIALQVLEQWKKSPKKTREKTPEPEVSLRIQPLRCSVADVLKHLNRSEGKHLYSYTAEADQLSLSNRSGAFANVGVIMRQAYDGSEFRSSYAGENSVNANVKQVLWNMTLCTTPDGLRRAITNVTDGELTRVAIAITPDNTFAPLVKTQPRKEKSKANIQRIAALLELMHGQLDLPLLEERSNTWLEDVRISSLMDDDHVRARQRFRVAVTAMRSICCLMLCDYAEFLLRNLDDRGKRKLPSWANGAETAEQYLTANPLAIETDVPKRFQAKQYLEAYDIYANYLLDNILYYFRSKLAAAYQNEDYKGSERKRTGTNDSVYARLSVQFTVEEARRAKGDDATDNQAQQMVKNWKKQGLILQIGRGVYKKLK